MNSFNKKLARSILEIQNALGIETAELLDKLRVTSRQFEAFKRGQGKIRLDSLMSFCEALDLSIGLLLSGQIDLSVLAKKAGGYKIALPERYLAPSTQFGRARTVLGIISYMRSLGNDDYLEMILRKLQLQSAKLLDPDERINPFMITDLMQQIHREGTAPVHLQEMGRMALSINRSTRVGQLLGNSPSPDKLYETLHAEIMDTHYDQMFTYALKHVSDSRVTLVTSPRADTHESLGVELFGSRETCLYRQGVYGSFLGHINYGFPKIVERKCLYLGDDHCEYDAVWNKSIALQTGHSETKASHLLQ